MGAQLRGTILHFDNNTGTGFITGEDDFRYRFTRSDISSATPAYEGMPVDFIPDDRNATQIFALPQQSAPPPPTPAYEIEPELSLWQYAVRASTRDYARFSGRARRKEYWGFALFAILAYLALMVVMVAGGLMSHGLNSENPQLSPLLFLSIGLFGVFALAIIIPSIAVTVRRFHDIGKSGWFYLLLIVLSAIPLVNFVTSIALLVMTCLDGQPVANQWGPPTKAPRIYVPN